MFYGNFGMFVRALAYTLANGPDGLRQTTEDAVLNANYIRAKLEGYFDLPYKTRSMHEVVFSDKLQAKNGVKTGDMGKRLIDYGFHAYTVSFPMIVSGAMMIEPTESESREELDLLIDALQQISREAAENPELVKTAPHSTRIRGWTRPRRRASRCCGGRLQRLRSRCRWIPRRRSGRLAVFWAGRMSSRNMSS